MRPLGKNQLCWLETIADHPRGQWFPRIGFYWSNDSASARLCDSLVKRGLLVKTDDRPTYKITADGRRLIREVQEKRRATKKTE